MRSISIAFVICLAILVASTNGCNPPGKYITHSELLECLNDPYDPAVQAQTITTLSKIIPSYVFLDPSRDSPDPEHIPLNVDLAAGLDTISKLTYSNDAAMQQAFSSLFAQLQDAHTRYTKPVYPYLAASFVLPLTLYSRVEGSPSQQNIYLHWDSYLLDMYASVYGPLDIPTGSSDVLVTLIDSKTPLDAIGTFANTSVGYTKDYSARFNLAIDGYGGTFPPMFTWRNQSLQGIPEENIQFTVINPTDGSEVTIPLQWMGVFDPPTNTSIEELRRETEIGVHQLEYLERLMGMDRSSDLEEPDGNPDVYYQILSSNVGVLRIYTFSPKNISIFISTIEEAITTFAANNITRLIIDLSQNGGGNVCLGYAVSRFIFPDLSPVQGAYDIKASDLFLQFSESGANQLANPLANSTTRLQPCGLVPSVVGYFTPCAWYDWFSKKIYSDQSWIVPGRDSVRGGVSAPYSAFITQGCEDSFNLWVPSDVVKVSFDPGNVILVSDGLCGSTCAVFSRHLQLSNRAKTITTGGVLGGQQPSFTSFPGGEVVHLNYIENLSQRYGIPKSNVLVPPPLPTTADFRFAIREIYGWEDITLKSVPQEFTYVPADWQIFYENSFENRTAIWNQVLPYFDVCAEWETASCYVENGAGSFHCSNGLLNKTKCYVEACNPGYFYLPGSNLCTPCGNGFYKSNFGLLGCTTCPNLLPANCQFSQAVSTSPTCPFVCNECPQCTTNQDAGVSPNTVCMETWVFCLVFVFVVVLSFALSTVVSCLVTRKFYKKDQYSRLIQDMD